jgi:hypothetical protein
MGKQSKRKTGSKKEHKERQEERRIRAIQEVSTKTDDDDDKDNDAGTDTDADADGKPYDDRVEEIMVGDRVWWRDQPPWQRGIVRRVVKDELEPGITNYMVQPIKDGDGKQLIAVSSRYRTFSGSDESMKTIKRDRNDWVPRFSVGDRVLCHTSHAEDDDSEIVWAPATVSELWITPRIDNELILVYVCGVDAPIAGYSAGDPLYVKEDLNGVVIKEHSSIFRFAVSDAVLFSTEEAVFLDNRAPNQPPWREGKVAKVDCFGLNGPYAVYEVSFVGPRNRITICRITVDDDQHICRVDATPRERLMDAIDQRCSYAHIDYLVSTTELDVTSFRDLLVARAIQSCSYDAI